MPEELEKQHFTPSKQQLMDQEIIESYLRGTPSSQEKSQFEARLEKERELLALLKQHTAIKGGVVDYGREKMKMQLQQLEKEQPLELSNEANSKAVPLSTYLKWAAIIVLAMAPIFFFLNRESDPQELFAAYYQPYPNYAAAIERGDESENLYKEAFQLYEQSQYPQAINLLLQLIETRPDDVNLQFYLGLSYLSSSQHSKAIPFLQKVVGNRGNRFEEQAQWYLALALLKEGHSRESIAYLKSLVNKKGYNYEVAEELLSVL